MKHKIYKSSLTLIIMFVLVISLVGVASAQEGRIGQIKEKTLSMQLMTLMSSLSVDDTPTANQLAGLLVGTGPKAPTISNVVFTGDSKGSGSFSGGSGIVGFESGVILGSGRVIDVIGPNTYDNTTWDLGLPGDSDLNGLIPGYTTYDATVLEFDFECSEGTGGEDVIYFSYVFTSEEYNEYVNRIYNDVFGFFLNGANIALLPGTSTPVSINNVNNGYSPGGGLPGANPSNPAYYINNDLNDGGPFVDIEADGLTIVLDAESSVNPGVNHLRLAIADAGDHVWDSWVFIKEGSFVCNQPPISDPNGPYLFPLNSGSFDGTGSYDPDGDPLTYDWDFGDGNTGTGATPSHTYAAAGFYDVCLIVNDGYVDSDEACTTAVIYDSAAGFMTGGGWIDSPAGAYLPATLPFFDGSYYQLAEAPNILWDDANAIANAMTLLRCGSPHLVTITSQEEQDALYGFFGADLGGKWYGGFQDTGVTIPDQDWNWVTGEPWGYTNWGFGEPNDVNGPGSESHLAGFWSDPLTWNDEGNLYYVSGYVVEYDDCLLPSGKANFGFNSKYKKGAAVPTGNVEFQFQEANLNFHSKGFEWLVVTDGSYARLKGTGTINGEGDYKFMLWAADGSADTFRIKILEENEYGVETVIYDNGSDQAIGGGSIVIHKGK